MLRRDALYDQSFETTPSRRKLHRDEKRAIGAYYTPGDVADTLASWAIRTRHDRIFEPSFGGCDLIRSSLKRLAELNGSAPHENLFGCDIDPDAFQFLYVKLPYLDKKHFLHGNFLDFSAADFDTMKFDVLIGNPPYIRHHHLSQHVRASAKFVRDRFLPELSMQANLWTFFVVHGCSFLNDGGRAAWILPHSLLHATYARPVRDFLQRHFASVQFVTLDKRIFRHEGADEGTVIALLDGWRIAPPLRTKKALGRAMNVVALNLAAALQPAQRSLEEVVSSAERIVTSRGVELGSLCKIRIGAVTGDSAYFLFNKDRAQRFSIPTTSLRPILSKGGAAKGISINDTDLRIAFEGGWKTAIIDTAGPIPDPLEAYLQIKTTEEITNNITFNKRKVWHQPLTEMDVPPHAFLTSMVHINPRLILSSGGIDCTNSMFRVIFKLDITESARQMASLSLASTYGQLSAELTGRAYGAGLLKHEPSDARRLRVANNDTDGRLISRAYFSVDEALRSDDLANATNLADDFMKRIGFLSHSDHDIAERALHILRGRRIAR